MKTRPTCGRLELLGLIEDYRQGPPNSRLASCRGNCQGACQWHAALNRHPVPTWVDQLVYLHPYPKELMLCNHV